MSILGEEISCYPDNLLDESECKGAVTGRKWWVFHTRPRQEKSLARELVKLETPFYLPLIVKTRKSRGRKITSRLPLFSGYVFALATDDEIAKSLLTNRIAQTLEVSDERVFVSDLHRVRRLIESKAPLTVESKLAPGHRVRIRDGLLAGMEGTILRRGTQTRILVAVNFLQSGVSTEIEDFMLERID